MKLVRLTDLVGRDVWVNLVETQTIREYHLGTDWAFTAMTLRDRCVKVRESAAEIAQMAKS